MILDKNKPHMKKTEEHNEWNMETVTHLKLLLLAGGSFSQALSRAWSLLSWSWMLQIDRGDTWNVWKEKQDVEHVQTSR